jgi:hypothetical protein
MKYLTIKRKSRINTITGILFLLALLLAMGGGELKEYVRNHEQPMVKPMVDSVGGSISQLAVVHVDNGKDVSRGLVPDNDTLTVSQIVEKEVKKFAKTPTQESYLLYLTHCLLWKESKHGSDQGKGDGGLASGILQFHQATFVSYRNLMIKQGFTDHVGSRDNFEDAVETNLWAVTTGRASAWGPVVVGYCKTK